MLGPANRRQSWARQSVGSARRAQYHLCQVFVFLSVDAVNQPGNAADQFDAEGNLTNETTKDLIRQLLGNLVRWTRTLQQK